MKHTPAVQFQAFFNHFTSRKHGKKEPQLFYHCGSFDHHDLQSLNNCIFAFTTAILKIWGHVIHRWKGIFKTYVTVKSPQILKIPLGKPKNKYAVIY